MACYRLYHEYSDAWIRKEIQRGADVNAPVEDGMTYLMLAHSEALVRELLALGADPHAVNIEGQTALFDFSLCGSSKDAGAVRALLEAGCDIHAEDKFGRTALNHCGNTFPERNEVVRTLIEFGADVNHADCDGTTPLHTASGDALYALVDAGANVNAATKKSDDPFEWPGGTTPLMLASDYESAKYLIDHGADIHAKTSRGRSVLMELLFRDSADAALAVIEAGANLNEKDKCGNTTLHALCGCYPLDRSIFNRIFKKCLTAGCDPNACNKRKETPLNFAWHDYAIKELIKAGAKIESVDTIGNTALHHVKNNLRCIRALLAAGAHPNPINKAGRNPLFNIENAKSAVLLIEAGADVNCVDLDGKTPLRCAVLEDNRRVVAAFLKHGANPNLQDKDGKTPLHYAVSGKNKRMTRLLLEHHADPGIKDNAGTEALSPGDPLWPKAKGKQG